MVSHSKLNQDEEESEEIRSLAELQQKLKREREAWKKLIQNLKMLERENRKQRD